MRARIEKNVGLLGTVAVALAVISLYSLWGMTLLDAQRHAAEDRPPVAVAK